MATAPTPTHCGCRLLDDAVSLRTFEKFAPPLPRVELLGFCPWRDAMAAVVVWLEVGFWYTSSLGTAGGTPFAVGLSSRRVCPAAAALDGVRSFDFGGECRSSLFAGFGKTAALSGGVGVTGSDGPAVGWLRAAATVGVSGARRLHPNCRFSSSTSSLSLYTTVTSGVRHTHDGEKGGVSFTMGR